MKIKLFLSAFVLLVLAARGAWEVADSRSFQLFGRLIDRAPISDKRVALTFDDGPTPEGTDSILAILADEGVAATFFVTGAELAADLELGRRFVAAGHELGNHSYSHRRFLLRTPSFIRGEIETTDSLIRAAGHSGEIYFRPPYGKKLIGLPWYLSRTGRTTIMWDIEPESHPEVAGDADRIVDQVREHVAPGSIVILHVMYPSRRESHRSVRGIIRSLHDEGYQFVRVSELLAAAE